jgi:hypothetical protein
VHFDKGPGCNYDLKASFADGTNAVWTNVQPQARARHTLPKGYVVIES